jgi:hypothetical protein
VEEFMVDFIRKSFRGLFTFVVIITIICIIIGGIILSGINPIFGLLTLVIGFILIISFFGIISIFINIDKNLDILVNNNININKKNPEIEMNNLKIIFQNLNKDSIKYFEAYIMNNKNKIDEIYEILKTKGDREMNLYINYLLNKNN